MGKRIVITGCSTGFGYVTAVELAKRGWHVFGTVRKESDRDRLLAEASAAGYTDHLTIVLCDITNSDQVAALTRQLWETPEDDTPPQAEPLEPHLHALLNNAGTGYGAPLELLSPDDLRTQFEINVFAHFAVTQAMLPMLKAAHGTIINVSSIGGRISTPIAGAYNASKFATEALSDAWRIELAPFGVRVVIIEPGSSPTGIWQTSLERSSASIEEHRSGPYERLLTLSEKVARRSTKRGFPPQLFADTVVKILESSHPRARYAIPLSTAIQILVRALLPDRLWDYLVRRATGW